MWHYPSSNSPSQGKKGEGFIFQVPSSIEGFFFQLPSSVDPGLLIAIPGLYMYEHQVGPLVSYISTAEEKPHTEDDRQRCVAWHMQRGFASVVYCLGTNYPKFNELKQPPFYLLAILSVSN